MDKAQLLGVIRPNSEIIIPQIKAFIKSHGFKVKENIGSSEYKIDLAVVHPDKEQEYCAAIQVDGHQYARRITKERFSPILLMPVNLGRVSAKKGYYVQARDEEVQINISLIEFLNQKR